MKIAINMCYKPGPYGGGNLFVKELGDYLKKNKAQVVDHLQDKNIDLILIVNQRKHALTTTFGPDAALAYLQQKKDTIICHRINACNTKGRGMKELNKNVQIINAIADQTVLIGSWMKEAYAKQGIALTKRTKVILNGGNQDIFNTKNKSKRKGKIRLVTHHWSNHYMKGWDVYEKLDELIGKKYADKIEFHYIGHKPAHVHVKNIIMHKPVSGNTLAKMLKENDIYVTAAIDEAAGMHHIEGALCGLPLLYRLSGGLPEYCKDYGIAFEGTEDVEEKLLELIKKKEQYQKKIKTYNNTTQKMCSEYYRLFKELITQKKDIVKARNKTLYQKNTIRKMKRSLAKLYLQHSIKAIQHKIKRQLR